MEDYLLGVYEKSMPNHLPLAQKLTLAQKAGFDYLELSIDETQEKLLRLKSSPEERRQLLLASRESRLPIKSLCLSAHRKYPLGSANEELLSQGLTILEDAILFAAEIGVRVIQLAGYDVYYEPSTPETQKRFAKNLAYAATLAAREGVSLALETMETAFMNTCTKAMAYIGAVNSPYLGLYPDTGNLHNACPDVCADLRSAQGHLFAAHLKETLPGVFREVPFGTGHTNFPLMIRTLHALGVRLFLGEFWYDGQSDPLVYLSQAQHFLRSKFQEAQSDEALLFGH